jgi:hypothetical protein
MITHPCPRAQSASLNGPEPMKILILNGPRTPRVALHPHYRGTDRAHPTYCDALPENHEVNKHFFWFLEEGGESGVVHDLTKAWRYAELLNSHLTAFSPAFTHFEIVEVCDGGESSQGQSQFLGFDLSAGYNNSLLSWGLDTKAKAALSVAQTEDASRVRIFPGPILELYNLLHRFYAPQLNQNGLFQTSEVASQCLRSMDALQQQAPNLYEGNDIRANYNVVGVYLVPLNGLSR